MEGLEDVKVGRTVDGDKVSDKSEFLGSENQ